ncbi:MAG: type II toxin-antitoxin system VapC family toxin [Chloroflexota bacterium]
MKETVYIETSVVSYLTGRPSRDMVVAAHQELTRQWWDTRASGFEIVASELVREESSGGDADASRRRMAVIENIPILKTNDSALALAERLVFQNMVPQEYAADSLHIAVAAVNGIDYLLTWNCTHLANAVRRHKIEALVDEAGYACPVICTPEELMEE